MMTKEQIIESLYRLTDQFYFGLCIPCMDDMGKLLLHLTEKYQMSPESMDFLWNLYGMLQNLPDEQVVEGVVIGDGIAEAKAVGESVDVFSEQIHEHLKPLFYPNKELIALGKAYQSIQMYGREMISCLASFFRPIVLSIISHSTGNFGFPAFVMACVFAQDECSDLTFTGWEKPCSYMVGNTLLKKLLKVYDLPEQVFDVMQMYVTLNKKDFTTYFLRYDDKTLLTYLQVIKCCGCKDRTCEKRIMSAKDPVYFC